MASTASSAPSSINFEMQRKQMEEELRQFRQQQELQLEKIKFSQMQQLEQLQRSQQSQLNMMNSVAFTKDTTPPAVPHVQYPPQLYQNNPELLR